MRLVTTETDPDNFLHKKVEDVTAEELPELLAESGIIKKMLEVFSANKNAIGLAANQVGIDKRIAIVDLHGKLFVFINPEITKRTPQTTNKTESCLSCKGSRKITRSKGITVKYMTSAGTHSSVKLRGEEAIIMQHEVDHLDGKLIID